VFACNQPVSLKPTFLVFNDIVTLVESDAIQRTLAAFTQAYAPLPGLLLHARCLAQQEAR
jgi:hypothetical protein